MTHSTQLTPNAHTVQNKIIFGRRPLNLFRFNCSLLAQKYIQKPYSMNAMRNSRKTYAQTDKYFDPSTKHPLSIIQKCNNNEVWDCVSNSLVYMLFV